VNVAFAKTDNYVQNRMQGVLKRTEGLFFVFPVCIKKILF